MKKTYKYIIASVVFSAASLLSGLNLNAQNLPTGVYLEEDGICFRKSAKQNPDGKTYTIDLESFVKGKISYTESADPSDIVLVLDVSGSMNQLINTYSYAKSSVSSLTGESLYYSLLIFSGYLDSEETNYFFKHTDGEYYQVYKGHAESGEYNNTHYFFLYYKVDGTTYYITTSGTVQDTRPTNVTSRFTNLLNPSVQLYDRTVESSKTRLEALKEATIGFIREVAKNAMYDKKGNERQPHLDHRIAIVKFSMNYYNNNENAYEEVEDGNHLYSSMNYTEVMRGLKSVESDSTSLINAVNALTVIESYGQTYSDYGMKLAYNIINKIEKDRISNKTVVFFTDGSPKRGDGGEFTTSVANAALKSSNSIKSITYGTGDNATHPAVFSVGVFSESPSQGDDIYTFMDRISSDYPGATSMTNVCSKESSDFYKDASGGAADLKEIFKAIAGSAASQGSTIGSSSAVTVDVVTNSFSVPVGYEDHPENAITVLVAPCEGTTKIEYNGQVKDYLVFGEAKTPEEYKLAPIKPAISEADNKVTTTGFDYSANFCGPDESGSTTTYRGYKQIIRFTITLKDEAVGGPNVATNDPTSGIYVDGEKKATFNRPTVKIPVQIWIQKTGLKEDDSAVFTLYATPYVEGQKEEVYRSDDYKNKWKTFTKVIVNSENMVEIDDPNNPGQKVKVVKLVGLDPDYYYRLKEDAWAFGYQYQTSNGIVDTIGDEIKNPILIENSPKDIVFDEAVYRNVFKEKKPTQE